MKGKKIKEKGPLSSRMNLEKEDLQVRFNFSLQMVADVGQAGVWMGLGDQRGMME